ncbi:hypothetical protein mvi_61030 (plasmid) [Methylobacterium indicum]|uniref:Glutamine amidotransferase domain-containing protein n=2 Tax=Methylobacterium indicum TaxID=1775910 RepID=A0A8H8X149_9HYPH|nr:hypothetical protein mvi_61030 [Methylobacterium indicum]
MSANDSEKYIREEIAWLSKPLGENKPYLGICLGAQLLTRHLGSKVYKLENGAIEAGYYPIIPLPQAQELTSEENILFPEMVYQWHSEGCDLPYGATLLAEGLTFPVQAYQYGSHAFAIQFHPEVTYMTIDRWTRLGGERLRMPGAKPSSEHLSDWHLYDQNVAQWIKAFLPRWLNNEDSS